jgi:ubiquinone biosynthesis protein COQ4
MFSPIRTFKLVKGSIRVLQDPNRLDDVFEIADALLSDEESEQIAAELVRDEGCARALAEQPRLGAVDLEALAALPEGTLGRAFAEHMLSRGLELTPLTDQAEEQGHYIAAHLFETHDIWHVVAGFDTDVAGELGLQAFYLAQFPGSLASVLIALGLLHARLHEPEDQRPRVEAVARGWTLGRQARPLFGVRWAEQWTRSLAEVRGDLGLS